VDAALIDVSQVLRPPSDASATMNMNKTDGDVPMLSLMR